MKRFVIAMLGLTLLGLSSLVRADAETPDVLVKNAVNEVIAAIKQENKDKKKIQALVDEKVLPLFDFTLMTKRAVGRIWRTASAKQKKALVEEFRDLLVRVFISKAFTGSGNFSVRFEPSHFSSGDSQATVRTKLIVQGESPLSVDYDLKKTSSGWKVVDFAIAGPRLALDIYRNQFRTPLQRSGVDGLIKFLVGKNHDAELEGSKKQIKKASLK